jgi:predicted regulator of Ras-like GTPase activity (Roadblock/LC7/MglB family)
MAKDESGFSEIEEYSKKLSHNPESLVFVPLAEAYRKSGMLDEAIQACQKGLQLHPSYMSARMVLGRAYMEKEMLEEAATEFKKVAAADVNNIMAHALLGQIFLKQGQHAEAIKQFQRVLTLNPDDSATQNLLNQALEHARQTTGKNAPAPKETVVERKAPERSDRGGSGRDNDKITSDDILSVMKDSVAKASERAQPEAAPSPKAESKPAAPASLEKLPALNKLMETEGILGSMILDLQGTVLTSTFNVKIDIKEVSVLVAEIIKKTEKSIQVLAYGKQLNQILITGERGQIIFSKLGPRILLVLANENINLGKMRLAMNEVVRALR